MNRYVIAEADGMESILQTVLELLRAVDPNVAKVLVLDGEGTVIDYAESRPPAETRRLPLLPDHGPFPAG